MHVYRKEPSVVCIYGHLRIEFERRYSSSFVYISILSNSALLGEANGFEALLGEADCDQFEPHPI